MRVVLDTNVLLSALISSHGLPGRIYRSWRKAHFKLVTSTVQLDELRRTSRYEKFKGILQSHHVGTMMNNMHRAVILTHLPTANIEVKDPNDAFLLAMAQLGEADYLVTGDHRAGLIQQKNSGRTRIVTPYTFCAETSLITEDVHA